MEFQLIESFPNNNPSYSTEDSQILFPSEVNSLFSSNSYIELHYYNGDSLLNSNLNYSFYSPLSPIEIDNSIYYREISLDLNSELLDLPSYLPSNIVFNFFTKKIGSNLEPLFISEISSDRTEIRLDSTSLSDIDLSDQASKFIAERNNSPYFVDFYINLGENKVFIANNLQLDSTDPNNITLLVKLYEPLPTDVNLNTILWVVIPALPSKAYSVEVIPAVFSVSNPTTRIKGPNFNIDLKDQVNNSTQELSYVDLITTSLTSSQNQLNSLLEEKEIDINIDYTNFEDFIHFSSAQTRLENFYYKASLLEQYSSSIYILDNATSSSVALSQSKAVYEAKINEIITNFDGWDYYLYYSSGSQAWPKLNNEPPYQIAPTGSIAVINWFGSLNEASPQYGGIILSASLYDESNKDNLLFSIPEYLRDNSSNESYILFIDMVAQHYDNIWVYYKDVTNLYNADNRLEYGISKDIVADAIRDFGVKLYQNNFSNQDLYTAFLGLTPEGGLFPFPNITGSLPTPSGLEYVDILVSASNDYIPLDDVNKSLYKRIYHNLPYLLKSRGTLPGLRALITSYGIPDTVLRINEYGGKDKVDSNDWDYWQNEFNYKFTPNNSYISSSWALNPAWGSPNNVPATLMFRFQSNELPTSSIPYSQSLWANNLGSTLTLRYTGSAYTSGSYSGSIKDPYYQYAHLDFYPDKAQPTIFSSIYLPFFDNGWWSVMINRSASVFTLSAANKIYEGGDNGTVLGFYTSSLVSGSSTPWVNSTKSYFPSSSFSGSYQEIRYYSTVIAADIFKDYTMNPYSIEGNSLNDSSNELAFRASLGGELYTGSKSIHPKVTGSWATTHSFASTSNFYFSSTPNFVINREYFFYDQPIAGIKNAVSDKIRLENDNIPTGNTLSPFRSLAQTTEASASYTAGTNLLEVAFSPQNEINDDINSSIGYFNIGNFIGDPAFRSSRLTSYPDLDQLRNEYFEKYTKNYNLVDFIRLIKFFDNSLFKMIRDFVPARTSLASGVVIKQTLLERNRYPEPQVDTYSTIANIGVNNSSSAFLIPGNDTVSVSISYPITASGVTSLSITGSITEDAIDSIYYIRLYNPSAVLLATLDSFTIAAPFNTSTFSGSYVGVIPQGSYIHFSADPGAGSYQINNFTASLQLLILSYTPYTTQNILVSGTVAPQWNDYQPGTIENFSGGTGGTFEQFNGINTSPYGIDGNGPDNRFFITQSWTESYPSLSGSVLVIHSSQDEFYDGEFSGSILTVTTQSLNQAYPQDYTLYSYKPIHYYESTDGSDAIWFSAFINPLTVPNQGEIFFYSKKIGSLYTTYVKIAKLDCDGNNNYSILQDINSLFVYNPSLNLYLEYKVDILNENPTYFLYECQAPLQVFNETFFPNQILNYYFSASNPAEQTYSGFTFGLDPVDTWGSISGNSINYFDTSTGLFTLQNTPNTRLSITASLTVSGSGGGDMVLKSINPQTSTITTIASASFLSGGNITKTLSSSYYALQGDKIYVSLVTIFGSEYTVKSGSFLVTQSRTPETSSCSPTIFFEPNIVEANFYNSDENALINNIFEDRLSTQYQDVDYSTGALIPTNFDLLVSGSAQKAPVQDSNYTLLRHINPRYNGSKSTSQYLNEWTIGDSGTYGKIPNISSLYTLTTYCEYDGGYPPEHMNAAGAKIKYIIDPGFNAVSPNLTPEAIYNVQSAFRTNEYVKLDYTSDSNASTTKKIIRGGYRIEPIFYNQTGHYLQTAGINTFTGSIEITNISNDNSTLISDYTLTKSPIVGVAASQTYTYNQVLNLTNAFSDLNFYQPITIGAALTSAEIGTTATTAGNKFTITNSLLSSGLSSLTFRAIVKLKREYGSTEPYVQIAIRRNRGGNIENIVLSSTVQLSSYTTPTTYVAQTTIPLTNLNVGDEFVVSAISSTISNLVYYTDDSLFTVSQTPQPTPPLNVSGSSGNLFFTSSLNGNSIYSTSSQFISYYGNPNIKQKDISGSGFFSIQNPIQFFPGDEFRFEGNEDNVYMVKRVDILSGSFSFATSSINVELDKPISGSNINVNQFLVRRYIEDGSIIIFESTNGYTGDGALFARPKYVTDELNTNINTLLAKLSNNNLI
jgi:hypothetical protein